LRFRNDKLENENRVINEQLKNIQLEFEQNSISNDYLQDLVNDVAEINVYDKVENVYCNELVQCAINLTNLKVATKNVTPVIREVGSLCGRKFNSLPSRTTVDNFIDRKISISHKQIAKELAPSKHTTLYTDDTRKYGHTYESYIITDDKKNSYLIGLREMLNKSGACTLDTLKTILGDISHHCKTLMERKEFGVGFQLLSNTKNAMSD